MLCVATCHLLCGLTKYTVIDTALNPALTMGMPAISPGIPQVLFSQSHQHRSVGTNPLKSGTSTTVVMKLDPSWELKKQPRLWPGPVSTCTHSKPTAGKARPVPAVKVPVVHSDVLQVLSLQSRRWWHRSADHTAIERGLRFQLCFQSHAAPEDQL